MEISILSLLAQEGCCSNTSEKIGMTSGSPSPNLRLTGGNKDAQHSSRSTSRTPPSGDAKRQEGGRTWQI